MLANDEQTAERPVFLIPSQVPGLSNRLYDLAKGRS